MKKKIVVTKKDIAGGQCGDPFSCAIAQALKRSFKLECGLFGEDKVMVGNSLATVIKGKSRFTAPLTKSAAKFIEDFDEKRPVKPTAFTLVFRERPRAD